MKDSRVRDLAEILRDELVMREVIVALLSDGNKTIPEIADAMEHPKAEVLQWVMAMWNDGVVEETGRPDEAGYYHYQIKQ
jgi:hypothetical protein